MNRFISLRKFAAHSILATALLTIISGSTSGQTPDTAVTPRKTFGVGRYEFLIGIQTSKWPTKASVNSEDISGLWDYAHALGASMIEATFGLYDDNLLRSQCDSALHNTAYNDRLVIRTGRASKILQSRFGREIQFYPFDSVQSQLVVYKFLHKQGGDTNIAYNQSSPPSPFRGMQERIYDSANATSGDTILSTPVYQYDPLRQTKPYSEGPYDDDESAVNGEMFFRQLYKAHDDLRAGGRTFFIATTGHLGAPLNSSPNSAVVLTIEVRHVVPTGIRYLSDTTFGHNSLAAIDTFVVCDTFQITKGEFLSGGGSLSEYREVVRRMYMRVRGIDSVPGPFHHNQPDVGSGSYCVDIRVRWTGAEKVALRSVAIRDSIGQLVLGSRADDINYRATLIKEVRAKMLSNVGDTYLANMRSATVIRIENGAESATPVSYPSDTEYARTARLNVFGKP